MAVEAGAIMLSSGGEISRVEETIGHVARAFGVHRVDAYATPTGLFVTGEGLDGAIHTIVRRVPQSTRDLSAVVAVNDLSRRAVRGLLALEEAEAELEAIRVSPPPYTSTVVLLAAGIGSAASSFLFGGSSLDMIGAAVAGTLVQSIAAIIEDRGWGVFARAWAGGFLAAAAATVLQRIVPSFSVNYIVVGAIMTLVPGVTITNALRDIMGGQLVSGVARIGEALAVAVGGAAGVGLVLGLGT